MKTSSGKPLGNLIINKNVNNKYNFYYICNNKIIELLHRLIINSIKYIKYNQTKNKTNNKGDE